MPKKAKHTNNNNNVAREIMYAAAQSVHEHVWHVKWDQGERNK